MCYSLFEKLSYLGWKNLSSWYMKICAPECNFVLAISLQDARVYLVVYLFLYRFQFLYPIKSYEQSADTLVCCVSFLDSKIITCNHDWLFLQIKNVSNGITSFQKHSYSHTCQITQCIYINEMEEKAMPLRRQFIR